MTEHKFTDEEIVKALEVCADNSSCKECPINPNHGNYGYCTNLALTYALDLIIRQKAEIERLQERLEREAKTQYKLCTQIVDIKEARAEAIKEFAEKVKFNRHRLFNTIYSDYHFGGMIDTILKEMAGEQK